MAYIPKSKYQFLQASGHEYFYPKTKTPYIGPYILTSEGAFIGKNINQKNKERLVPQSLKGKKQDNIFFTSKTNEYYRLKPNTSKFIQKTLPIIATKVKPTEKDYERGYYTRYFCKRNNAENVYFEINKSTYKNLKSKNNIYNHTLYTSDSLIWAIDGDIIKANNTTLKLKVKAFPNITSLFIKLNEFQKVRTAKKGELTYLDGKEYMGYYHIHLGKPMEGLYHENKSHQNLLFVDKNTLYKKDLNIEQTYYTHGPYNDLNRTNNLNYTPSQLTQKQTTNILLQPTNTPPTEEGGY
jgi:flavodoxin